MRDCLNREVKLGDVVTWPQMSGHSNMMRVGVVRGFTAYGVNVETHYQGYSWQGDTTYDPLNPRIVNIKKSLTITGLSERQYDRWMRTGEVPHD